MAVRDAAGREIHVGDRVRVIKTFDGQSLRLRRGTVAHVKGVNLRTTHDWEIGVVFDKYMDGHDLDGACAYGYGRWGYAREVEIIDEPAHDIEIKFQFDDIFG